MPATLIAKLVRLPVLIIGSAQVDRPVLQLGFQEEVEQTEGEPTEGAAEDVTNPTEE